MIPARYGANAVRHRPPFAALVSGRNRFRSAHSLTRSDGGGDAAPSGSALNLGEERARLARAQTAKTMLDIAKRRRDLLPRDEVVRDGKAVIGAVRAKLLAMPSRLVQMGIVEAANRPRLEAYLHEAMEEMSRWKTRLELLEHQ